MDRGGDEIADGDAATQRGEEVDAFLNLDEDGPTPDQLLYHSPTATSADLSFDEVLAHAVPEVSALIPVERVILFVYDKNTHLLVPRFVSSVPVEHHDDNKHPEAPPSTESMGFPPVMGLVSTCFLHKRCLRMQGPHPHRAFHREYDAPKDMVVDSILCAPIVLHHRVIGVIELLNRTNLEDDAPHASFETLTRLGVKSSPATTNDDEREIKLRRLKTVKPHARQTVESRLKQIARRGESQTKLREEHAKSALALLSILNEKLDYQSHNRLASLKASVRKTAIVEPDFPDADLELPVDHRKVEKPPPIDSLHVLMTIIKMQAMFRGRRERRAHNFADALEKFRVQIQKIRSAILIQRLAEDSFVRRRVHQQRYAVRVLSRVYKKFKFRITLETHIEQKKKARAAMSSPTASVSLPAHVKPRLSRRKPVVLQDTERFRAKVAAESATSKDANAPIKDADCVNSSHRVAIIKLQSFVRGSLARKRIKEMPAIHRTIRLPTVVCLRIASTSSSGESCNQLGVAVEPQHYMHHGDRCVYAMPGRIHTAAHLVQRRSCATRGRLEELYDHARNSIMAAPSTRLAWKRCGDATRRLAKGKQDGQADSFLAPPDDASGNNALFVDTRRLAPTRDKSNDSAPRPAAPFSNSNILNMPHRLSKAFPVFAFAPTRKSRTTPGAIEFAAAMHNDDDQPHTSNQNPSAFDPLCMGLCTCAASASLTCRVARMQTARM